MAGKILALQGKWVNRPGSLCLEGKGMVWQAGRVPATFFNCLHGDPCLQDKRPREKGQKLPLCRIALQRGVAKYWADMHHGVAGCMAMRLVVQPPAIAFTKERCAEGGALMFLKYLGSSSSS